MAASARNPVAAASPIKPKAVAISRETAVSFERRPVSTKPKAVLSFAKPVERAAAIWTSGVGCFNAPRITLRAGSDLCRCNTHTARHLASTAIFGSAIKADKPDTESLPKRTSRSVAFSRSWGRLSLKRAASSSGLKRSSFSAFPRESFMGCAPRFRTR